MTEIAVTIDIGGDVETYFFDSTINAKAAMTQAIADGFFIIPAKATGSNGGQPLRHETYVPLARILKAR